MTRRAIQTGAVNLAQRFPDFGASEELKRAAAEAIAADYNQYFITWGAKPVRDGIAGKYRGHDRLHARGA
jgi:aspartate/methionine/tyrosine aminotransferase